MDKENYNKFKPIIRSILLSLGRDATKYEFEKEYLDLECESFGKVLSSLNTTFIEFMQSIPDVVRISFQNNEYVLKRVSDKKTAHMNHLTVKNKYDERKYGKYQRPQRGNAHSNKVFNHHNGMQSRLQPRLLPKSTRASAGSVVHKVVSKASTRFYKPPNSSELRSRAIATLSSSSLAPHASRQNLPKIVYKGAKSIEDEKKVPSTPVEAPKAQPALQSVKPLKTWTEGNVQVSVIPGLVRPNVPTVIYRGVGSTNGKPTDKPLDKPSTSNETKKPDLMINDDKRARDPRIQQRARDPRIRQRAAAAVPTVDNQSGPAKGSEVFDKDRKEIEVRSLDARIAIISSFKALKANQQRLMDEIGVSKTQTAMFYRPKIMSKKHEALLKESRQKLGPILKKLVEKKGQDVQEQLKTLKEQLAIDLKAYDEGKLLKKGHNGASKQPAARIVIGGASPKYKIEQGYFTNGQRAYKISADIRP